MHKPFPLCLFLLSCVFPLFSQADDHILVTATRTESSEQELPFSLASISGDAWDQAGGSVENALAPIPGLSFTANGGPGQTRSLLIRGANAAHTLVLVDGVPVNDPLSPSRSFDFSQIPAAEIERIEVLKGPGSVLYGSDAMGGVVQIFTKKDTQSHARLEAGSYGTVMIRAATLGFHAGYESSGGFSAADEHEGNTESDGLRRWNMGGRQEFALGDKALMRMTAQYEDAKIATDRTGGRGGDSIGTFTRNSQFLFRDETLLFLPHDLECTVAGSLFSQDRQDNTNGNDFYKANLWKAESILRKPMGAHGLTAGGEYAQEAGRSSQLRDYRRFRAGALYLQDQFRYGGFHGTAGGRLDLHSETETARTFRLGLGYWLVPDSFRVKGSYGTGFKAPTLYQTYSTYGTPGLRPERSVGMDLGVEWLGEDWRNELAVFQNRFRDLIDFNLFTNRYFNQSRAETYGLEWSGELRSGLFLLQNSLTLLRAIDRHTRLPLYRRPRLADTLRLGYRTRVVGANLVLRFVGGRDDVHPSLFTRQPMPAFATLGAQGFRQLSGGWRLVMRMENLLNRRYQETSGYGVPGISGYAGLEADL